MPRPVLQPGTVERCDPPAPGYRGPVADRPNRYSGVVFGVCGRRQVRRQGVEVLAGLGIVDPGTQPRCPEFGRHRAGVRALGADDTHVEPGICRHNSRGQRPEAGATANDVDFVIPHRLVTLRPNGGMRHQDRITLRDMENWGRHGPHRDSRGIAGAGHDNASRIALGYRRPPNGGARHCARRGGVRHRRVGHPRRTKSYHAKHDTYL